MPNALQQFTPETAQWFAQNVGTPTPVQSEGWPQIAAGGDVLISAPTGTGKTLCAFLVFLDRLKERARAGEQKDELTLLYISPLKALGNDIRENLQRPMNGIAGPELRAAVRTGDTAQSERQKMLRRPPHILITTPESVYLLLTSVNGRRLLSTVKAVIVDELHVMMNDKRGAHLMLSLARLDALCGQRVQRIGLSATVEPLEEAARFLSADAQGAQIVAPKMEKSTEIHVTAPLADMRVLPEGTIWPELARSVVEHCEGKRTVIVFLEGRAQAEKLAFLVNEYAGAGFARTHHGCVSKEQRLEAEQQLRSGALRLLCATSSMELGIDVGEVDLVLQIAYPRTVSSCMQRLGRAGHNPGRTSEMHLFPRTAAETVYCGLTATLAAHGGIEQLSPPRKCLDVVAQHLVSMAAAEGYTVDGALEILRGAYPFREVTREELCAVLGMLAGDYEHELDRPVRPRVLYDRIHGTVSGDEYSRLLAVTSGGTIPDRGWFSVRLADGTRLGELDEEYVFEARVGDRFLLGSFAWRISVIGRDSVTVEASSSSGARAPFWKGDQGGRDYRTGCAFGEMLRDLTQAAQTGSIYQTLRAMHLDTASAVNGANYLQQQIEATGCLPDDRTILAEHFHDESGGNELMVHSVFGGRVNDALALLLQEQARQEGMQAHAYSDDDGFLLCPFDNDKEIPQGLLERIDPNTAQALLTALLPKTALFNMTFRYNANRALLMGVRKGQRVPLWVQRLRGAEVLENVILQQEHPLIAETRRECLENYWDIPAVTEVLRKIGAGDIRVTELRRKAPSPMSLPLRRQVEAQMMYEYNPMPHSASRAVDLALEQAQLLPPEPEQLEKVSLRAREPQNAEQLHALLMTEGDLIAGEAEAPIDWLTALARAERACYIEPGLWICAEQREQYRTAMEDADHAARLHILRRCLRYRGAQDAQSAAERYVWPQEETAELLAELAGSGKAVAADGVFYHAQLYERAQRESVFVRREQAKTVAPAAYAALMAGKLRKPAPPAEQLEAALRQLKDRAYPAAQWEEQILPARVTGYRTELLDNLLATGEYRWQLLPGERLLLRFCRVDLTAEIAAAEIDYDAFSEQEAIILKTLTRRGACFSQALSMALGGGSPLEALFSLAEKGMLHADSFVPVAQLLQREKVLAQKADRRSRAKVLALTSGRWELDEPLPEPDLAQRLERAFEHAVVLCRETAQGIPWSEALELLRVWEYTGRVRRGYFIRGLSGAQFIRAAEHQGVVRALAQPAESLVWLNAADPLQCWGSVLPHEENAAFVCVSGTAVALKAGVPVALFERRGGVLRVLHEEYLAEALDCFVRDFRQKQLFPGKKSVTVKQYPKEAAEALEKAGFRRQMLDYVLWNSAL